MPRLLSAKEVVSVLGVGRTTLWRLVKDGEFPSAKKISAGRVGWLSTDVEKWVESRA